MWEVTVKSHAQSRAEGNADKSVAAIKIAGSLKELYDKR